MTPKQFNRTNFSKIMSYEAYQRLHDFHYNEAYPRLEKRLIPILSKSYKVVSKHQRYSKMIEKIIYFVCRSKNWNVRKPHDKGRQIIKNGKPIWIKSKATKKGEADRIVEIPVNNLTLIVNFEVKYGKDRQKDYQKQMQKDLEARGQLYFIIKTIDDFWQAIDKIEMEYLGKPKPYTENNTPPDVID